MPTSERLRLIRLADRENKLIIEDDYDSEFGYFNRPTPSLQGLDCGRNVIYIGTFSKLLLPSIRLSFMILPDALLGEYEKKAELYNQTASKTEQIALCSFIRDGNLSIRIRKIKRLYTQKMKLLTSALKDVFGDKANIYIGETGFVLRLEIKCAMSEKEIAERALISGVAEKISADFALVLVRGVRRFFAGCKKTLRQHIRSIKNVSKTLFVCCITRFTVIKYQQ